MRAYDEEVGFLASVEFGNPLVVGVYLLAVEGHQFLLGAQDDEHSRSPVDGAAV